MTVVEQPVQVTIEGMLVTLPPDLARVANQNIKLKIDGKEVEVNKVSVTPDPTGRLVPRLTTIFDAAKKAGVDIPILCHREYMNPVAVCRVCSVEVRWANGNRDRVLAPACYRPAEDGMVVSTHHTNQQVRTAAAMVTELLMADHPTPCEKEQKHHDCELERYAREFGTQKPRLPRSVEHRPHDESSLVIAVDHNACILCDRCVRGCDDIRNNQIIGRMGKGYKARIAFDLDTPMGNSNCVACGECMVSCPTGALTDRAFARRPPEPDSQSVTADELARMEFFQGVSRPFLTLSEGSVVRRRFKKGDIICREGEFGATAFLIEKGRVEVRIQAPIKHLKMHKNKGKGDKVDWGFFGLLRRFTPGLANRSEDHQDGESTARFIHIDAPVALEYTNPVATMGPGDLFGEMTCMSSYPRSATVVALEDCTALEMGRNILYILQRSEASRKRLERVYRERAVDNHLRTVRIFAGLLRDEALFKRFVDFLRPRVELVRVNPGDVIFRQDAVADDFYLVRVGFVKVSQQRVGGGEHVLSYVGPGGYLGEIGLMSHIEEVRQHAPEGKRTATCSAIDHVDLIRIKGEDFKQILDEFPAVRQQLTQIAIEHLKENEHLRQEAQRVDLGNFLKQGLQNAQSLLVLDLEKCTRCDECTKACSDSHGGVTRLIREGMRFDKFLVASSCRSCLDPYCMVGCPVDSIHRKNSREIVIEDWCIGCGNCANNCPYGNINMHEFVQERDDPSSGRKVAVQQQKATMCDLCVTVDGQPSCVYACPHDAAHRMNGEELLQLVETGKA